MIKFSIIIPTYNSENYILDAVRSIQKNHYSNYEIIIVDNGSTDNTVRLIKNLKHRDCRVKFKQTSLSGTGTSRNIGISMAVGDYLLFLDSDDLLSQNAMNCLESIVKSTESDFVIFQNRVFEKSIDKSRNYIHHGKEIFNMGTMVWNKAISIPLAKRVSFPEGTLFEDVAYSVECYLRAQKPIAVDDVLYFYRLRVGSIIRTKQKPSQRLDILKGFKFLMDDLQRNMSFISDNQICQCQILINCTVIDHIHSIIIEWGYTPETRKVISKLQIFLLNINKELKHNLFFTNKFPMHYKVWLLLIKFNKLNIADYLISLKN